MIAVCPECAGRVPDPLSEYPDRCGAHHLRDLRGVDDALADLPLFVPPLTDAERSGVSRAMCALLHREHGL